MHIKCKNCGVSIDALNFSKASIVFSAKYHAPAVQVILVCPHCSQHYCTDVPAMEFTPCEAKQ